MSRRLVEPPSLRVLINIETNVMVDAPAVLLTTTVLGTPVRVRATPGSYRWTLGGGDALTATDPGAPYPEMRITHVR